MTTKLATCNIFHSKVKYFKIYKWKYWIVIQSTQSKSLFSAYEQHESKARINSICIEYRENVQIKLLGNIEDY